MTVSTDVPTIVLLELPRRYQHVAAGQPPPVRRFALVVHQRPDQRQLRELAAVAVTAWDPDTATARLHMSWPARTMAEAVAAAVRTAERVGLRTLRIDVQDWVTAGEIARRIGRSRETVRLWAVGRSGPGGFPPPLNPGCETTYYSWSDVRLWLRSRLGLDPPGDDPALVAANLALQLRSLVPRVPEINELIRLLVR